MCIRDRINATLTDLKSQLAALQTKVENGDYVTGITKTADGKGMTFTFSMAILNLPKGTEHFLTDIHGEYEAFQHVLKNASFNDTVFSASWYLSYKGPAS